MICRAFIYLLWFLLCRRHCHSAVLIAVLAKLRNAKTDHNSPAKGVPSRPSRPGPLIATIVYFAPLMPRNPRNTIWTGYLARNTHLGVARIQIGWPMMSFRLPLTSRCVPPRHGLVLSRPANARPSSASVRLAAMIDGHLSFSAIFPFICPKLFYPLPDARCPMAGARQQPASRPTRNRTEKLGHLSPRALAPGGREPAYGTFVRR